MLHRVREGEGARILSHNIIVGSPYAEYVRVFVPAMFSELIRKTV
jgi:hypothetical protein